MSDRLNHEEHVALINTPSRYFFEGFDVVAPAGVYHPHKQSSTRQLLSALQWIPESEFRGKTVLEIGGGTGALSLVLHDWGANVWVTDIDERAVVTMECNALQNRVWPAYEDIFVIRQGDLFDALEDGERFDWILFNPPLLNKVSECSAEESLCDPGGWIVEKFLVQAPSFLLPGGRVILLHSPHFSAPLPSSVGGTFQVLPSESFGGDFEVLQWML